MSDKNKEHEFWCASYLGGVCDCSLSEYEDLAEDHGLNGNNIQPCCRYSLTELAHPS